MARWRPWQRPSPKLIAGVVGVVVPAAALSPLISSFTHQSHAPLGNPAFGSAAGNVVFWSFRTTFSQLFPDGLFLLALMIVWIVALGAEDKRTVLQPVLAGEAVGWLFLCIPLAGFVIAEFKTGAFAVRYFISALPGVAVAFSCCMWRHFRNAGRVRVGVFLLLVTWGIGQQAMTVRDPEPITGHNQKRTRQFMSLEDSLEKDGKRFIVFPSFGIYLDSVYYSKRPSACFFMMDSEEFIRALVSSFSAFYPMQAWTFDDLRQHARDTALIQPKPEVLDALRQAGFGVEVRFPGPLEVVYLKPESGPAVAAP